MYDLILRGGRVIDTSQDLDGFRDVAVRDGLIARIAPAIDPAEASQSMDVGGYIVVPGLIDVHTHIYDGVYVRGVNPDEVGVYAGVTTLVDAGSSGCDTFGGFPRHVIPHSHTEIICFLHICRTGLATTPDIFSRESIDLEGAIRTAEDSGGVIKGIKARMVSPALEIMGMEMPRLARRAARESGIKLMVHIGDTEGRYDPGVIRELLPLLDSGDILTHLFTEKPGGVLDANGRLVPEVKEAVDRGVWLDTAHGRGNFSFEVGQRVLDQGVVPHCISTDITIPGRLYTVHSMTEMMTRFLAMGFDLGQVVAMCTVNPARAIGEENRLGSLEVGRQADVSVLELMEGDWVVRDVAGGSLPAGRAVVPFLTLKRGEVFMPHWGPRSWGWEPDRASG